MKLTDLSFQHIEIRAFRSLTVRFSISQCCCQVRRLDYAMMGIETVRVWHTIVETKYGRFFKISTIASGADSASPDEDESATRSYSSEAASAAARAALLLLSSGCTKIRCLDACDP